MVAKRVVAVCEMCGRGYSALKVGEGVIVATNDGCCLCGNREFVAGGWHADPAVPRSAR